MTLKGLWRKNNKRKIYLINPKFQLTFGCWNIIISLTVIGVLYLANFSFFWTFYEKGRALGLPSDHIFFQFISRQESLLNIIYLATSAVVFLILVVTSIILSHKVAGPLYRLNKHMEGITQSGQPIQDVKFRKGDFFPELATSFNAMIARVSDYRTKKSS